MGFLGDGWQWLAPEHSDRCSRIVLPTAQTGMSAVLCRRPCLIAQTRGPHHHPAPGIPEATTPGQVIGHVACALGSAGPTQEVHGRRTPASRSRRQARRPAGKAVEPDSGPQSRNGWTGSRTGGRQAAGMLHEGLSPIQIEVVYRKLAHRSAHTILRFTHRRGWACSLGSVPGLGATGAGAPLVAAVSSEEMTSPTACRSAPVLWRASSGSIGPFRGPVIERYSNCRSWNWCSLSLIP